jgi:DNA repair protein RecO (recombination protein O)
VRGVAKSSRKLKSRFGASLEPFTLSKISYYHKENQELVSLRQAEIVKSHFDLSSHAEVLAALAYMSDLVLEFSPPFEQNERLFRMLNACLEAIAASKNDLQSILRYFEVWLLKLEGYLPDVKRCAECHLVFADNEAAYLGRDLMLRCVNCGKGTGSMLSHRLQGQLRATHRLAPGKFAELTHQMIGRVLERQPRLRPTL